MKIQTKKISASCVSGLVACMFSGCSVDDNATSFAAALTKPKLENAALSVVPKENSADASAKPDDGILRTRSRSLVLDYSIRHEAAQEKAWSKDVAKWGVVRTLKDEHTGKVEIERVTGLSGRLVVPLGAQERLVQIEVSPRDGSDVDAPLGGNQALRVLHDETPPRVNVSYNVFRDASLGQVRLVGSLTYEDLDPAKPQCRDLRATGSDGKEEKPLTLAPWEKVPGAKKSDQVWKATFSEVRLWNDPDVVSMRVVCSDGTGNLTESISSGRSDETEFELRTALSLPKDAFEGIPRLGARDKKRWIMGSRAGIDVQVKGFQPGGIPLQGDVGRASLAGHTLEVILKVEGEDDRVLLAGPASPLNRAELPPTFWGDASLEIRLSKTTEQVEPIHVETVDVFVPSKTSPSFSLFAPAERIVPRNGNTIEFLASALLNGLPFESGQHPVLEWTQDGRAWEAVPGARFETTSARADGEENWRVLFPFPFQEELPVHFRLKAINSAGKVLVSEEVKNPFAHAARKPQVSAGDRTSCAKARLRPVVLSRYACVLVDSPHPALRVYRLSVAFQNTGAVPFQLPSGSAGIGYEVQRRKGAALLESKHGVVVTTAERLNGEGLEEPAVFEVDLPGWTFQPANGESIRVEFDKEAEGGHSLAIGNTCDAPDFFPFVELTGPQIEIRLSPFPCE